MQMQGVNRPLKGTIRNKTHLPGHNINTIHEKGSRKTAYAQKKLIEIKCDIHQRLIAIFSVSGI